MNKSTITKKLKDARDKYKRLMGSPDWSEWEINDLWDKEIAGIIALVGKDVREKTLKELRVKADKLTRYGTTEFTGNKWAYLVTDIEDLLSLKPKGGATE